MAQSDSFLMTEEGLVPGTPTYMSPEQAPLPGRVEELLRRCLAKDPRHRLRDIGEALVGLAER